ncbi:Rv3654c family TadE-like protein [Gordonia sp. DT30]|uniref:Rv3654c family TadE-like protein n=1 Tax=unclassified Gordonia (in: high G+C Gram-positive bacteria) TaxID=2657482 RepID=UPI003CF72825
MRSGAGLIRDERGYATVAAAGLIVGLVSVLIMLVYVGAAVVARHRAQSAADIAALAAAVDQISGGDACPTATTVVAQQRTGARLRHCRVGGEDVIVEVVVPIELGVFGSRDAVASARAGPVQ